MNETKFTKGEWSVVGDTMFNDMGIIKQDDDGIWNVARVWSTGEETGVANANLIAAAPDLYVALNSLLELVEHSDCHFSNGVGEFGRDEGAMTAPTVLIGAEKALAKARGESQ